MLNHFKNFGNFDFPDDFALKLELQQCLKNKKLQAPEVPQFEINLIKSKNERRQRYVFKLIQSNSFVKKI